VKINMNEEVFFVRCIDEMSVEVFVDDRLIWICVNESIHVQILRIFFEICAFLVGGRLIWVSVNGLIHTQILRIFANWMNWDVFFVECGYVWNRLGACRMSKNDDLIWHFSGKNLVGRFFLRVSRFFMRLKICNWIQKKTLLRLIFIERWGLFVIIWGIEVVCIDRNLPRMNENYWILYWWNVFVLMECFCKWECFHVDGVFLCWWNVFVLMECFCVDGMFL